MRMRKVEVAGRQERIALFVRQERQEHRLDVAARQLALHPAAPAAAAKTTPIWGFGKKEQR
jgi:hypothetical protein